MALNFMNDEANVGSRCVGKFKSSTAMARQHLRISWMKTTIIGFCKLIIIRMEDAARFHLVEETELSSMEGYVGRSLVLQHNLIFKLPITGLFVFE